MRKWPGKLGPRRGSKHDGVGDIKACINKFFNRRLKEMCRGKNLKWFNN